MERVHSAVSTAGNVDKVKVVLPQRVTGQPCRAAGFMCDKEGKWKDQKIQGCFSGAC